jgi:hypothetical protein
LIVRIRPMLIDESLVRVPVVVGYRKLGARSSLWLPNRRLASSGDQRLLRDRCWQSSLSCVLQAVFGDRRVQIIPHFLVHTGKDTSSAHLRLISLNHWQ